MKGRESGPAVSGPASGTPPRLPWLPSPPGSVTSISDQARGRRPLNSRFGRIFCRMPTMSDTKSNEAPQPQPSKTEWWRAAIPLAVLLILWFCPLPDGLSAKGMHMFAIFAATIVSILTAPLPTGAIMFIALTVAYFTGTLTLKEDLAGFSSGTVWLIFSAYHSVAWLREVRSRKADRVLHALEIRRQLYRYRLFARSR